MGQMTVPSPPPSPAQVRLLLATAAVSSCVGLVLELLLATQASYLEGNSALATGVVVGTFLASMGLGAWLSQYLALEAAPGPALLRSFVLVELALVPLCLAGPLLLFALFAADGPFWLGLVLLTLAVGVLGGMELPLLTRLLETGQGLRTALAKAMALDYLGALVGSLLFPLVLLPWLGLVPTSALLALVPLVCAAALGWNFPGLRRWRTPLLLALPITALAALAVVPLGQRIEDSLYEDPVVGRQQSRFQRIVLTRRRDDLRLYLDGQLQFSSLDEYRYHEALVHPPMAFHPRPRRVLLLGAGDGLAVRELLRWPSLQRIDLIELDPALLQLARSHPFLRRLNQSSLDDPRVHVQVGDAFAWIRTHKAAPYDVVIADFPDPDSPALARLYSLTFYGLLRNRLAADGLIVTQASSPFFSPKVMASIRASFAAVGLANQSYSVDVPSFGPWGFVLAHRSGQRLQAAPLPFQGRWIDPVQLARLFDLPRDLLPHQGGAVLPNRLSRPVILDYARESLWRAD